MLGIKPICIYPGSLWENRYNERYNGTLRQEVLKLDVHDNEADPDRHQSMAHAIQSHAPHPALNMRQPAPETLIRNGPGLAGSSVRWRGMKCTSFANGACRVMKFELSKRCGSCIRKYLKSCSALINIKRQASLSWLDVLIHWAAPLMSPSSMIASWTRGHKMNSSPVISFRNLDHSIAVEQHVVQRFEELKKFHPGIVGCHAVIGAPRKRRQSGRTFEVFLTVMIPGPNVHIHESIGRNTAVEDINLAVHRAFDAARRCQTHPEETKAKDGPG